MNPVIISLPLFLGVLYCGPSEAESVIFSFRKNIYRFIENFGNATIHVDRISGSNDRNIILIVSRNRGMGQMITFGPKDNEAAITFNIKDDNIALEPFETFTWYLEVVTVTNGIILQPYNRTIITILDDDELLIGFAQNVSVFESENATLCITFNSNFLTNFSIDVRLLLNNNLILSNPSTSGEDNSLPNFSVEAISTLHGPDSNLCFDVSIIQEEFLEYGECFVAVISLPNSVSSHLMVEIAEGKDTAVVCIENDDRTAVTTEIPATTGPTNIITSNQFGITAVFVIAGIVLFLVAVLIIVVVIRVALRNSHRTQNNNRAFTEDIPLDTYPGSQASDAINLESYEKKRKEKEEKERKEKEEKERKEKERIKGKFIQDWVKGTAPDVEDVHVFIINNDRSKVSNFKKYKASLLWPYRQTEEYYHGTKLSCDITYNEDLCDFFDCGICGISDLGFDSKKIRRHIYFQRFGPGFYLAPNSSKSHDYTQGAHTYRALLLCDVCPGRKYILEKNNPYLVGPPSDYDSIYGKAAVRGDLNYDEIVLSDADAILPKYIIVYKKDGEDPIAK